MKSFNLKHIGLSEVTVAPVLDCPEHDASPMQRFEVNNTGVFDMLLAQEVVSETHEMESLTLLHLCFDHDDENHNMSFILDRLGIDILNWINVFSVGKFNSKHALSWFPDEASHSIARTCFVMNVI